MYTLLRTNLDAACFHEHLKPSLKLCAEYLRYELAIIDFECHVSFAPGYIFPDAVYRGAYLVYCRVLNTCTAGSGLAAGSQAIPDASVSRRKGRTKGKRGRETFIISAK